jgi:6-phosphofructokinase 1
VSGALAIVVGGGPAPGINGVIAAAVIRARLAGTEVYGIRDGFSRVMKGDLDALEPMDIADVSRLHFRGGSVLGTSRANPTKNPEDLQRVVDTLKAKGIDKLITIGGDDTSFSAVNVQQTAGGSIRVAHVPKTIDNDLDLPPEICTFGYQTARHHGVEIIQSLMTDARTTGRWYIAIAMGRSAGHLALGIGKAAGATLTLIPEEFDQRPFRLDQLVDTIVGSVLKRIAEGRKDGVAVVAEGVVLDLDERDLQGLGKVERDDHGHMRIAEINVGEGLRSAVRERLAELGHDITFVSKDIGYELRCIDPIPFDAEYTRDLGYAAAKYLLDGGGGALVTMQGGRFVPLALLDMLDANTGRMRVRRVDVDSTTYAIARRYMIRLRKDDFASDETIKQYADLAGMDVAAFRNRFEPLVGSERPPLTLPV